MNAHTPTPWTFRDVAGAGLEIRAPVYQVFGVELPVGMPSAPIQTFILTGPQVVQVAAERWVQFEPKGWHEMQEANAAFIVKAVNSHEALVKALEDATFALELVQSAYWDDGTQHLTFVGLWKCRAPIVENALKDAREALAKAQS